MDPFTLVPARDAGASNGPLSNRAPQILLEEGPDPCTLIGHAAQMGENALWLTTTNNGEVHPPLQGDTSIVANEWMEIHDFLHSGSNPIDVLGMEIDTSSISSGRRCVGDGIR